MTLSETPSLLALQRPGHRPPSRESELLRLCVPDGDGLVTTCCYRRCVIDLVLVCSAGILAAMTVGVVYPGVGIIIEIKSALEHSHRPASLSSGLVTALYNRSR